MKILVLLLSCALTQAAHEVGTVLPFSRRIASPFECGTETGFYCSDCNSLAFCSNRQPEEGRLKCRDMDPERPYCDPRRHTCSPVDMCMGMPSDFWCPKKGTFPDVTDCMRYILCTGANRTGSYYACLNNKTYNQAMKGCVNNNTCTSYSNEDGLCKNSYKVIPYEDPTMFVQCMGRRKPILRVCMGQYYEFNGETMKCQFKCAREGRFADNDDVQRFIQCDLIGERWIKNLFECPRGQKFVSSGDNDGHCGDWNRQAEEGRPAPILPS